MLEVRCKTIEEFCQDYENTYMRQDEWAKDFAQKHKIPGTITDYESLQNALQKQEHTINYEKQILLARLSENEMHDTSYVETYSEIEDNSYIKVRNYNLGLLKQNQDYCNLAKKNLEILYMQYPGFEKEIMKKAYSPEPKRIDNITDIFPGERFLDITTIYSKLNFERYLKCLSETTILNHPKFSASHMRSMIIGGIGLGMLGIIVGLCLGWIWFALFFSMSIIIFFGGRYIYNDAILNEIPWEEINCYNFVLCFDESYAEKLSKEECGIPVESSEEIDQNYKEKYKQMSAKKENYIKTLSSLEKELRKDERALQQKEKEYMRCKNQDEKKRIEFVWKTACVSFENKKKRFHRLNDKMTTLLQEMQAEELQYREIKRAVLGAEYAISKYEEQEVLREQARKLQEEREIQKEANKTKIEFEIKQLDKRIEGIKHLQKEVKQNKKVHSKELWKKCCKDWYANNEKYIKQPNGEFEIKPYAYVLGGQAPYRLDHNNQPMVLLYNYDSSQFDGETRPAYYLEKTVSALKFAISTINNVGLTTFSVVDENDGGGNLPQKIGTLYDASSLKKLAEKVLREKEQLQNEIYGQTINVCNKNQAKKYIESGLLDNERDIIKQLHKMHYVFILPQINEDRRLMNNDDLWTMIKGNCGEYGFVPIFLIPQESWNIAIEGRGRGVESNSLVLLNTLSNVYVKKITLN